MATSLNIVELLLQRRVRKKMNSVLQRVSATIRRVLGSEDSAVTTNIRVLA